MDELAEAFNKYDKCLVEVQTPSGDKKWIHWEFYADTSFDEVEYEVTKGDRSCGCNIDLCSQALEGGSPDGTKGDCTLEYKVLRYVWKGRVYVVGGT